MFLQIVFCFLFLSCHCTRDLKEEQACRAEDGYIPCPTSRQECILRSKINDIGISCDDESDENVDLMCSDDEFTCRLTGQCVSRHDLGSIEDSCTTENEILLPCRSDEEFTCLKSRRCLKRWQVMDGNFDCRTSTIDDRSDEGASLKCNQYEFACQQSIDLPDQVRCIPREWIGDGQRDCNSGSDENMMLEECLNDSEFRCGVEGRCIPRYRVMDGFTDCQDASDESARLHCISESEFTCTNGRCIPRSWRENHIRNCLDGGDEMPLSANETCTEEEFRCYNGRRCIPMSFLCDGIDNCGDCSDEIESCNDPRMFRCPNDPSGTCTYVEYSCDAQLDCPNGTDDITSVTGFKCSRGQSVLSNLYCVIPQWSLDDVYSSCNDLSDICYSNGTFNCAFCLDNKTIIASRQICDGVIDCPDLSDECLCSSRKRSANLSRDVCQNVCYTHQDLRMCKSCTQGQYKCPSEEICIDKSRVCDGVIDCPRSSEDESACTLNSYVRVSGPMKDFNCDQVMPTVRSLLLILKLPVDISDLLPDKAVRCDGISECAFFEDECSERANCTNRPPECEEIPIEATNFPASLGNVPINFVSRKCEGLLEFVFGWSICNGIQECESGVDEKNCSSRIVCDAGKTSWPTGGSKDVVSVGEEKKCNQVIDCVDAVDEMNCSSSTHFYCESKQPLFISDSRYNDGTNDCSDGSDECPSNSFDNRAISSREHLIKSSFLSVFIWIMCFAAIIGNVSVFVTTIRSLLKKKHQPSQSTVSDINKFLVLNLSFADFLMGIALLVIIIHSQIFSGRFCRRDKAWRSSNFCSSIGISIVLSSEASVLTLVCLSSYRLYVICQPYSSRYMQKWKALMWILLVWLVSFTLALVPLARSLSTTMITEMWIERSPYFPRDTISFQNFHKFASHLHGLSSNVSLLIPYDWYTLEHFVSNNFPVQAPVRKGFFGYYSASALCMPRFYRTSGDQQQVNVLTSLVIIFNFVALMYIAAVYIVIYQKTSKSGQKRDTPDAQRGAIRKRQKITQRKITMLIFTDMCCWLPICIMTFVSLGGGVLPTNAYGISAVVLLPINSSLNPMIYSNIIPFIFETIYDVVRHVRQRFKTDQKKSQEIECTGKSADVQKTEEHEVTHV